MISPHCQLHQVRVRFVMPSYLPSPWKAFCRAQVCVLDSAQHTVEMSNHLLNHHKSCCHHSNHHLGKTVLGSVRTSIVSVIHDLANHLCRWHDPMGTTGSQKIRVVTRDITRFTRVKTKKIRVFSRKTRKKSSDILSFFESESSYISSG